MATGQNTNAPAPAPAAQPPPRDRQRGPWERVPDHSPYVPAWCDPEWSPEWEHWITGKWRRRVNTQTELPLRPAILPVDADKNPTEFARRFGIYPHVDPEEQDPDVGRSMMSPRVDPRAPVADPGSSAAFEAQWTEAEAWQSYYYSGPTTEEMIASGAYVPSHRFSGPPIEGNIHPLFTRDRWVDLGDFFPNYVTNLRWKFGNEEGIYRADDDRIWRVIEPALLLAGRILFSEPPYWNAILSLYHIRPVPEWVDGRTQEAKQQSGAPLPSVWLDENHPGMYPAAAELRQLGFRSKDTSLAILNQYLRFAIGTWESTPGAYAATTRIRTEPGLRIIICKFPEVKTAVTFVLANAILHELAHACRYANDLLLYRTDFALRGLPNLRDLGITDAMRNRFRPLAIQMFGEAGASEQYFFEEGPQCEEGKSFEVQLWGDSVVLGPIIRAIETTLLRPYVLACSWPWSHRAPDMQHQFVDRSFYAPYAGGGYTGYLLNPPAPAYNQWRPVPIESYARFFRESWWQSDFGRFGQQALKLVPPPTALVLMPSSDSRLLSLELRQELGSDDFEFISETAYPLLCRVRQPLLAEWLWRETGQVVLAQATAIRLKFEARTWSRTYPRINDLVDKASGDIRQLAVAVDGWLADSAAGRLNTADAQRATTAAFSRAATTIVTDDLMEVERIYRYTNQYAQAVIAIYSLLPTENDRRTVHRDLMTSLRNRLTIVRDRLAALLGDLNNFVARIPDLDGQNFLAPLLQGVGQYFFAFVASARSVGAALEVTIGLLADELIAPGFDYARHPRTLPAVPEARKRIALDATLRRAAVRPLAFIGGAERTQVRDAVERWLSIIEAARGRGTEITMDVDMDA